MHSHFNVWELTSVRSMISADDVRATAKKNTILQG